MIYHKPVLLHESIEGLNIKPDGVYVDVTYGGGGHARLILDKLGPEGKLFAFDTDKDALINIIDDERLVLINENYRFITRFLRLYQVKKVNGILADLGISSHQIDQLDRGFSTRLEAKLDMRMNQEADFSAWEIVNTFSEKQLSGIFEMYGELKQAKALASSIVDARNKKPIHTTKQLKEVVVKFLPASRENKVLAQIFQSLRIEVNQEIEVLKEFLIQVPDLLLPNGRLSVISYHSLEDRLVKRFIRNGLFIGEPVKDFYGNIEVPLKKIGNLIVPSDNEISENNRARSAKLRIAEKT